MSAPNLKPTTTSLPAHHASVPELSHRVARSSCSALVLGLATSMAFADTFLVTTTADLEADNPGSGVCQASGAPEHCSLRAAVQVANALGGGHEIILPAGIYVLTLIDPENSGASAGDLASSSDLTIVGSGTDQTIIDGDFQTRIFDVFAGHLTLTQLTVQHGAAVVASQESGGAARVDAQLTLNQVVMRDNTANKGGAVNVRGAGVLTVIDSSFEGNHVQNLGFANPLGAAIRANGGGQVRITGSTFAHHQPEPAIGIPGVITMGSGSNLELLNSTFSANHTRAIDTTNTNLDIRQSTFVNNTNGQLRVFSFDGSHDFTMTASVLDNPVANNCDSSQLLPVSGGFNVASDGTCQLTASGDLQDTSADLAPLANNGGPTLTHKPHETSPVINRVPTADCQDLDGLALTLDQRGGMRPINGACDAGAVESGANHLFSDRFEG
jgi:CSLREA domain-containing protein